MLVLAFIYVCASLFCNEVTASGLDDVKKEYMDIIVQCMNENPLSSSDLESLQNKKMPENQAVHCLFACAFQKSGMMDDKGYLSVEGVQEASKKYFSDEPDIITKSKDFTDACKSVNDVPVSDGDKGCERAALLYKCSVEKAPNFQFV